MGIQSETLNRFLRRHGIEPEDRQPQGGKCYNWNGGVTRNGLGYVLRQVPRDHWLRPQSDKAGYMLEHRLVMAEHFGRPLEPWETVHHINGDRMDNSLENLQLRTGRHGKGLVPVCRCCGGQD